ncbi:hypothetical protein [Bacillus rubiinfantis]|uniref:hypothetical protein n=1 Tax=Bacillus rubiinfantis TaxID=1499680 RepID=UPI0005AB5CA8|nr:hypothetical protein [Bacillus rubiinfantis]
MTAEVSQLELIQYLPPQGEFETFRDEDHFKLMLKEWGLASAKTEFWYKERNIQSLVTIKGYQIYGNSAEYHTIIIQFPNGSLSSIHPAYLKEMQQSSFGKESLIAVEKKEAKDSNPDGVPDALELADGNYEKSEDLADKTAQRQPRKPQTKTKPEKPVKISLPAEKVHFTAKVKQFALTYNPFNEENDEVVVFEQVQIIQDSPLELGLAWCSHSKTLKKFELAPEDILEFDGKVVAKKLAKGKDAAPEFIVSDPVLYKINNPSKINKK